MVLDREQTTESDLPGPSRVAVSLGWLAVAGASSLGAGAIHAAAVGLYSENRQAAIAFTVVAAIQLSFGGLALARPGRLVLTLGAMANVGIFGGWMLARTSGISFIDGFEDTLSPQRADSVAAGLAVVAAVAVAAQLLGIGARRLSARPVVTGVAAVALAALSLPGLLAVGDHGGDHGEETITTTKIVEVASAVPPTPFVPGQPIDLGGVEGVTPEQQARAENLLTIAVIELPQFADPAVAESMGFVSIGDGGLGEEHYLNIQNMNDDKLLDPDYPESLVYDTTVTPKKLVAAMFMMNEGDTLEDVPDVGGKLTQWHIHNNLCFAGPRVAGITDAEGNCTPGLTKGAETPMIHVWIEPHPCGPFSALEGIAGGTIAEGEERLCDTAHGSGH